MLLIVLGALAMTAFVCILCCHLRRSKKQNLQRLIEWTASEKGPECGQGGNSVHVGSWLQLADQSSGATQGASAGEAEAHEHDKANVVESIRIERVTSPRSPAETRAKFISAKDRSAWSNKVATTLGSPNGRSPSANVSLNKRDAAGQLFVSTNI